MPAPVALFVYNRPAHTARTLEALAANAGAAETDLVVFSDGPRDAAATVKVLEVRELVRAAQGFRSVRVVERTENLGLSRSIVSGVGSVLAEHGRVIVLEDDLVTSPHFLNFMNAGLQRYAEDARVASILGYGYPVDGALPETFFLRGADCWGWATWSRAWAHYRPDGAKLLAELEASGELDIFDFGVPGFFSGMLRDQIAGRNDSWAVRWYASAFLASLHTLHPGPSLVANIGFDGSGEHGDRGEHFDVPLSSVALRDVPLEPQDDRAARLAIGRGLWRRGVRKISKIIDSLRNAHA